MWSSSNQAAVSQWRLWRHRRRHRACRHRASRSRCGIWRAGCCRRRCAICWAGASATRCVSIAPLRRRPKSHPEDPASWGEQAAEAMADNPFGFTAFKFQGDSVPPTADPNFSEPGHDRYTNQLTNKDIRRLVDRMDRVRKEIGSRHRHGDRVPLEIFGQRRDQISATRWSMCSRCGWKTPPRRKMSRPWRGCRAPPTHLSAPARTSICWLASGN